jgi:hypothetical protein
MTTKISLLILFLLIVIRCSEKNKSEFSYYPNGQVESETRHLNDSASIFLAYYKNGSLRDSMPLINGYLSGRGKNYFNNGKLEKDCYWLNGLPNGPCTTYYQSGNLMNTVNYEDSIKVGNAYEYYDLPQKKIQYFGNYAKVKGKSWVNYQTWYDTLGNIKKTTASIRSIHGSKIVSLQDSLKVTFDIEHLEYPLLRVFISDYDEDYNLPDKPVTKVYNGIENTIVAYITPTRVDKQTARGYIQNYKVIEKFRDGTYKTEGKNIYWSYDYEVVNK